MIIEFPESTYQEGLMVSVASRGLSGRTARFYTTKFPPFVAKISRIKEGTYEDGGPYIGVYGGGNWLIPFASIEKLEILASVEVDEPETFSGNDKK